MREQYSNGDVYEGEWLAGEPHGEGKIFLECGEVIVGRWENGKQTKDCMRTRAAE